MLLPHPSPSYKPGLVLLLFQGRKQAALKSHVAKITCLRFRSLWDGSQVNQQLGEVLQRT